LKEFNALVSAAGLPKQRFHDLRHACISLLGAQGVQLKVIAEIVGHSDIRLTQNAYQHVYQESMREAASKMDALLVQASAPEIPVATRMATKPPLGRPNWICKLLILWSHPPGLNRRPADYESAALPTELGWLWFVFNRLRRASAESWIQLAVPPSTLPGFDFSK